MAEFKFPTEEIELPSKGLVYPKENPLSSGKIEIKYMTAKEEDILSNQSYIQKGNVLDKLLESVIVSKVDIKDLIVGDKNAVLIAARILGYGKEYNVTIKNEEHTIDLSTLENKPFDESLVQTPGKNEFSFSLPSTDTKITFKILTGNDELKIERENLYREAIPYLEKVYELENDNLNAARTLRNIFSALDETESYDKFKVIVAELENK